MIVVALQYHDKLVSKTLADGQTVTFGSGKKDTQLVPNMCEAQLTLTGTGQTVRAISKPPFVFNGNISLDQTTALGDGAKLFASAATGVSGGGIALPYNGVFKVGRRPDNDICLNLPFVSGTHFQLRITDGNIRVEDLESTNGLYLNGMKIKAAMLHAGDVLQIRTVQIHWVNNTLSFENVANALTVKIPQKAMQDVKPVTRRGENGLEFKLSPRIQEALPREPIILDRPPKKGQEYHPNGSRIASMLSMGAMAGSTLAMGMASPALAFARAISVGASLYSMAAGNKLDKQRRAEMEEYNRKRDEEYRTYIESQQARIAAVACEQRRILTDENPDPQTCIQMVRDLDRRIWERVPADRDFLDIRLGMGYEDLCVPIKNYAENRGLIMEDDELENLCNNIAEENRIVDYIPTRLPLRITPTVGIVGDRDRAIHLVRNMIVSLCTQHSCNDVQIVGIFDNQERARWAAIRWLPHIWDSSRQFRFLSFDQGRTHNICEILNDTLKKRAEKERDGYGDKTPLPSPHYVVIIGSQALMESEEVLSFLTSNDPKLGVSTIFMYNDMYELPQECGCFIDLTQEYPSLYQKRSANLRSVFSADPSVSSKQFNAFARKLAAVKLRQTRLMSALPSSVTFLEGMGVKTLEQLNVLERWRKHKVSDSLAAPIGILANGKTFELDIHYKAHGAHGLLAGTTGSGKSELLRTWILSMAVNYHPHEVNFVIIDYKGGGMANKLEKLPHVTGLITNIDTNITRSLVSLKREAKKRMELLKTHPGVDDVDQYMQLYYSGKVDEPMPHLIIVSDEFAELKKEEPEFLKELSSFACVGRSVGIHLVLATQRPTGIVDDQIDSNSRFRICMKVNSVQDSKELLKRPDAAGITQRGRAYVRIGEDEMFDLFQSYWSGAEYVQDSSRAQYSNQVSIVDVSGERIQPCANATKKDASGTDQLTAIVNYIIDQASQAGIKKLSGPWKPELPSVLPLHSLQLPFRFQRGSWTGGCGQLAVPIGLFDLPAMQTQEVQYLNFSETPHYGIYGGPASGKTTLLKTMLISMAMQFSPDEASIFVLDFGGKSLTAFRELPHAAMVISENDGEKLMQFMSWLQTEMDSRKNTFEKEGAANFAAYSRRKKGMPSIFVVIDNIQRLSTLYNETDPFLIELSMSGSDCGIHLVYTANNINKVNMNLRTNIGGNIALHLTDRTDYRSVIAEFPEGSQAPVVPGRALIRDTGAAEFQTAVYQPNEDEQANREALQNLIQSMKDAYGGSMPSMMKIMPECVTIKDIVRHYQVRSVLPLGLECESLQPVCVDLREKHSMLISSVTPDQGAQALCRVAELLKTRQDNLLYILDGGRDLTALSSEQRYAADPAAMSRLIGQIYADCQQREEILEDMECAGQETQIPARKERWPQICILLDSIHLVMRQLSERDQRILVQLCGNAGNLGVIAVAASTAADLRSHRSTDLLTNTFVDYPQVGDAGGAWVNWQKGVCIGACAMEHESFAQEMLSAQQRHLPLKENEGLLFDCGKAIRFQWMQ